MEIFSAALELTSMEHRAAYLAYLLKRLASSHIFVEEAVHARAQLI